MAEVETTTSTVDINDAIFCQHFKEVVSAHLDLLSSDGLGSEPQINATVHGL